MSQSKRQTLSEAQRSQLDRLADSLGEERVALSAGVVRLVIARARLGLPLNTPSRLKIVALLGGTSMQLTG